MSNDKIISIQYLRGLAALGVVLCHFGSNLASHPTLSQIFSFGQAGVHVFFLISGFIIIHSLIRSNYTIKQFFRFLIKRSVRIDPSYFITILLTLILFKTLSYVPSFKGQRLSFIPRQFFAHLFYVVPFTKYPYYIHVFWTLCVEFQFYLLIGLLFFLSKKLIYKYAFLILFSLSAFIPFNNAYNLVFNYAPIFSLGISLVIFYWDKTWLNSILPAFFLCLTGYKFGLSIFLLLSFTSVIVLWLKVIIKPLKFLGDISYSLYLTHPLTLIVFLGVMKRAGIDINEYSLIWLFIEVLTAILFGYTFYRVIEKPSSDLSKRIFYKKA